MMLLFYISLSLFVSFLCSMLEAVILSVTPSYLASLKSKKPKLFTKVIHLKDDIEKPLASILTFNTIAHTIGAAGAGAEAQKMFGNELLTVFSIILTLAILFFSEIIPKSIGANAWRTLLPFTVHTLKPMITLSLPFVWLSEVISSLFKGDKSKVSRDEMMAMADLGLSDGTIAAGEHRALRGLIKFQQLDISKVYTPAAKIAGLPMNMTVEEAYRKTQKNTFSRIIVYGIDRNDIKGYIIRTQLLQAYINESAATIRDIMKRILIIPQETKLTHIFNRLLYRREHVSVIINDDGEVQGLLSLGCFL